MGLRATNFATPKTTKKAKLVNQKASSSESDYKEDDQEQNRQKVALELEMQNIDDERKLPSSLLTPQLRTRSKVATPRTVGVPSHDLKTLRSEPNFIHQVTASVSNDQPGNMQGTTESTEQPEPPKTKQLKRKLYTPRTPNESTETSKDLAKPQTSSNEDTEQLSIPSHLKQMVTRSGRKNKPSVDEKPEKVFSIFFFSFEKLISINSDFLLKLHHHHTFSD